MDHVGAVERPMMEYSFPTADGTISSIACLLFKPTTLRLNHPSFKSFGQVCNSLYHYMGLITQKFLAKYFPPAKTAKMLNDITSFVQLDREPLYDAWERFKGMLRRCPHHELPVWRQVQTFYNGVTLANRATIDAAAGGTIMKKLPSEAFNIIDEIATSLYSYGLERTNKRIAGVHSIDAMTTLSAQMAALTHKVDNLGAVIWNGAP
ncbi:UNVERIFIED_CONTAM: hypothetical protein Slati_1147900 [Sesamum latifolium]|uniref:Retrotransposon gag domain-containing protein n=1 Tax=Sesamum latifolium TaxID=2727402 RepID=A0AAW2XDF6_9LAMI